MIFEVFGLDVCEYRRRRRFGLGNKFIVKYFGFEGVVESLLERLAGSVDILFFIGIFVVVVFKLILVYLRRVFG